MRRIVRWVLLGTLVWAAVVAVAVWPYVAPLARYARPPKTLVMPVDGMARTTLQSTWDAPRSGGRRHRGADLFAGRGTKVYSATRGTVWKVGMDRLGGRVVTVLGDGPAFYYYAHLDDWAEGLRRGDEVRPGQLLGYVGNSGNARTTPPHLHFGVYRVGWSGIRAVDPIPLLEKERDPFADE